MLRDASPAALSLVRSCMSGDEYTIEASCLDAVNEASSAPSASMIFTVAPGSPEVTDAEIQHDGDGENADVDPNERDSEVPSTMPAEVETKRHQADGREIGGDHDGYGHRVLVANGERPFFPRSAMAALWLVYDCTMHVGQWCWEDPLRQPVSSSFCRSLDGKMTHPLDGWRTT